MATATGTLIDEHHAVARDQYVTALQCRQGPKTFSGSPTTRGQTRSQVGVLRASAGYDGARQPEQQVQRDPAVDQHVVSLLLRSVLGGGGVPGVGGSRAPGPAAGSRRPPRRRSHEMDIPPISNSASRLVACSSAGTTGCRPPDPGRPRGDDLAVQQPGLGLGNRHRLGPTLVQLDHLDVASARLCR